MARASQSLHVVLIISIMLNVVLGVTTYIYNKQAFEKTNAAVAAEGKVQTASKEKQAVDEKYDRAKAIIGNREFDADAIDKKFEEDLQLAGQAPAKPAEGDQKPAIVMGYSQMVAQLCKTLDDRTTELKKVKNGNATLQTTFKNREAAKDAAIQKLDEGFKTETDRITKIESDYKAHNEQVAANDATSISRETKARQALTEKEAKAEAAREAAQKALTAKEKEFQPLITKIRANDGQDIDPPSGEITWVSLPTKTVWINRGRADSLQRGIRFTVYAAESNTSAKAVEKGTIEVTRIVADHQAECRIVDDKFSDPMTSNDKIFTAFWSPGQQKHFAVAGSMNLDGDGHNQVNTAIGLIKSYGGVVDCWLDEPGHRQGQITAATQYVVQGDAPSSAEAVKTNTDILKDAAKYQLKVWSLADFKQRMNYQKSSSVEHFGAGASGGEPEKPAVVPKAKPAKPAAASKADEGGFGG